VRCPGLRRAALIGAAACALGCGYSNEEWSSKVSENQSLSDQLGAQRQAQDKCDGDYAAAIKEIDGLKTTATQGGVLPSGQSVPGTEALEEEALRSRQLAAARQRFEQLRTKLSDLAQLGVNVEIRDSRMLIDVPGDVLFTAGGDTLGKEAVSTLARIADALGSDPDLSKRRIQVAAHTDAASPRNREFRDNWDLTVMQARAVLEVLVRDRIDPRNLSAAGYGGSEPIASNDTEDGRRKNRRIELVMMPDANEILDLNPLVQ